MKQLANVVEIGRGTRPWYNSKKKRAKHLVQQMDEGYVELGVILHELYDTPRDNDPKHLGAYQSWSGISDFGLFCERELGIPKRKANRLRCVGKILTLNLANTPKELRDRAIALGWTKLHEIGRIFEHFHDDATVETWVETAELTPYSELMMKVQKAVALHGTVGGKPVQDIRQSAEEEDGLEDELEDDGDYDDESSSDPEAASEPTPRRKRRNLEAAASDPASMRVKHIRFRLEGEQVDNVLDAIRRADELASTRVSSPLAPSGLISLICLDFLATNDWGEASDPKMVMRYLKRIEAALQIKLIAVKDGEVLYGERTFRDFLAAAMEAQDD